MTWAFFLKKTFPEFSTRNFDFRAKLFLKLKFLFKKRKKEFSTRNFDFWAKLFLNKNLFLRSKTKNFDSEFRFLSQIIFEISIIFEKQIEFAARLIKTWVEKSKTWEKIKNYFQAKFSLVQFDAMIFKSYFGISLTR